jgi:hypothetical protein
MQERRKDMHYPTNRARIPEIFKGDLFLKYLNITGCRIECSSPINIRLNAQYRMQVIPESAVKAGKFELVVESRWIRSREHVCEAAFMIVDFPKGKQFESYVDYLTWSAQLLPDTLL